MAQGLSSLLGGLAQGFTDLGKSTLDVLGGGTTNNVLTAGLDALINKKSYGQAVKDTEFDSERINPAFDKFFDKLRDLSKKGVALPAILAALGLGEYATENQEEDKDNGQQI